jgi:8-oxo-dGTP pyrophosphatase MutT (NUDIX family)
MMIKQLPISVRSGHKSDVRSQFAALCYRIKRDQPEILLVTSRRAGRWIAPKGWPMHARTPGQCAAQEAWEEAGVIGSPHEQCLGLYSYTKTLKSGFGSPCVAMIYPVRVRSLAAHFPEAGQRRRKWFAPQQAALRVSEPELARILRDFDPRKLPGAT